MKLKRLGVLSLSTALSLSLVAPAIGAQTNAFTNATVVTENTVETEASDEVVEMDQLQKEQLIERIHHLFPDRFTFLKDEDFRVGGRHHFYYPEGEVQEEERYSIYFDKEISRGQYVHGSFEFVGKNLDLVSFYYSPGRVADAFYPAKVSKEDAQQIAEKFMAQTSKSSKYQVRKDQYSYDSSNRTLTEPIRYEFQFERVENDVPVRDLGGHVTVLGNGEIVSYHSGYYGGEPLTFEAKRNLLDKEEAIEKVSENFNLELRYISEYDHRKKESNVSLSYVPVPSIHGVHAISGKWNIEGRFVDELPKKKELKMLVDSKQDVKTKAITRNEAKALAEKLLKSDDDSVSLRIHGIGEHENHLGKKVYYVDYMYETEGYGFGGNLEISADTGEIISYYDHSSHRYPEKPLDQVDVTVTYDQALEKAVKFIEQYAPSTMHNYAYPIVQHPTEEKPRSYHFSFPRIENGIPFLWDNIGVSISSETGKLLSFNSHSFEFDKVPTADQAVDVEIAKKAYLKDLDVNLVYVNDYSTKEGRTNFNLMYQLTFGPQFSYFDAVTGDWKENVHAPKQPEEKEKAQVKHRWAEEELNFMIDAGIIKVTDFDTFNPDQVITKGEALEVVMKSLTRFWDHSGYYGQEQKPTFENVGVDHPLFEIVERAAQMGIIDRTETTFDSNAKLTRQELASWYVKALRLQEAAKHSEIYYVKFEDAAEIDEQYKGHVALAAAFGILTGANEKFNPTQEVTLAQIAVATFRMATTLNTINLDSNYHGHYYY